MRGRSSSPCSPPSYTRRAARSCAPARFAALTALLPAAGSELLANTANLHFYVVYACFWAFVWRKTTTTALAARDGGRRRHVSVLAGKPAALTLGATIAIVAVLVAANFDLTSERSLGPAWQPELEDAPERCDAGADGARIPVAPEPFGFVLEAACRDLR